MPDAPGVRPGPRSRALFEAAKALMPGGVNSPVRAFGAVGGTPPILARGAGARVWDVDGAEYIDYLASWGPLILGHAHPDVKRALAEAIERGWTYGAPTEAEGEMARLVTAAFPSIEMVRFVSSGTEATMSALRLARACTGRTAILKFAGCYHGHVDALLVQAGSGLATFGLPGTAGVPAAVAADTLVAPYGDAAALEEAFRLHGERLAAVIIEPVAANMGVVTPPEGYLQKLRDLCTASGTLLIFDEVITGFRVAYGGAQERFGIRADITCLGKIVGGGLPVGAYGGSRAIMEHVAPIGDVYQAGTLSGNPLAMAAGAATLRALAAPAIYDRLEAMTAPFAVAIAEAARRYGRSVRVSRFGSMLTVFFTAAEVRDYASTQRADTAAYARFFHALLDRGVYFPPAQYEAAFVSLAHRREDIERTLAVIDEAFAT